MSENTVENGWAIKPGSSFGNKGYSAIYYENSIGQLAIPGKWRGPFSWERRNAPEAKAEKAAERDQGRESQDELSSGES